MTMNIEELYDRALALSSDVEDKFLELGRSLRQLLDRDRVSVARPPDIPSAAHTNIHAVPGMPYVISIAASSIA
jgi:hypothetical protein